ncbi:MAG: hypothetical protein Q9209_002446 [Squamulea sp. 1 TL-2023]
MADPLLHALGEGVEALQISLQNDFNLQAAQQPSTLTSEPDVVACKVRSDGSRPDDDKRIQRSAFMLMPLELRRIIYRLILKSTFKQFRDGRAFAAVYFQADWVDRPFPLLQVNKLVLTEVSDFLQPDSVFIRITAHGIAFDCLGLASATAQGFHRNWNLSKMSHLLVKIWPPHNEHPIEVLCIWNHVRKFRNLLREYESIRKLTLHFKDMRPFRWYRTSTESGNTLLRVCRRIFGHDTASIPGSDVMTLLDLFTTVTNVMEAHVILPRSTRDGESYNTVEMIMQGDHPPATGPSYIE